MRGEGRERWAAEQQKKKKNPKSVSHQMLLNFDLMENEDKIIASDENIESLVSGKEYCSEYLQIYEYMGKYFQDQSSLLTIRDEQREALLRWMTAICTTYQLSSDVIETAAFILDSFLSRNSISISQLQLFAGTSVLPVL